MATLIKGKIFSNGEIVTPASIHQLVDEATISGIVNADISSSAAIADTKLATISTANKVSPAAVTGLVNDLTILSNVLGSHTHDNRYYTETEMIALLDGKQASGSYAPATGIAPSAITGTAVITTDSRLSNARTPLTHTHDDRYYTETEIDDKLSGLPVSGHTHTIANVTNLQTTLDGKQASGSYAPATGIAPSAITGTAVITTDSRLSNARTPLTHTHDASEITSGTLPNARTTATNANTASAIVARDASGNFSAGSITGDAVNSSFGAIRIGRGSGNDATNTALGGGAPLSSITNGLNNVAVGYDSQKLTTTGDRNVSVGRESLFNNTTGSSNVAIGTVAGNKNSGSLNTAIGDSAAYHNTGVGNTALGAMSLNLHTTANNSTAIGYSAGSTGNFTNATSLGYTADVTANNQVQLGNSSTTTFAYGAVQNRSDERDKADIRPTILGLDFIKAIEPVDYKWDFREDYRPAPPQVPGLNATQAELDEYAAAKSKYLEDIKFVNLTTNGTHKRTRYHHGVIAQQVQQVIDLSGVDFGGFQDHKIGGGDDVLSIGYLEFIAPLIKAVQELAARVEALENL